MIRLLIFITIIPTVVLSGECEDPQMECIELCCDETQYYEDEYGTCEDIPEYAHISWETILYDNKTLRGNISETVEFVEYGECETNESLVGEDETTESLSATIPFCYSPFYHKKSKQFVLKKLSNVPCDRLEELDWITSPITGLVCCIVLPICLPIMLIYTCRKGLKEQIIFKLVSWYYISMVAYILTLPAGIFAKELPTDLIDVFKKYADKLGDFFFISSCLWLNAIGYQIWSAFKKANAQNYSAKHGMRLIFYSIYVWGIALFYMLIDDWDMGDSMDGIWVEVLIPCWTEVLIPCFNVVTFLILSVNICTTRCGVVNLTNETHFKRQLACLILRLSLMMGIPRMLVLISWLFYEFLTDLAYVVLLLEPFVIFIVLVLKPKNCFKWNFVCCCFRNTDELSSAAEAIHLNNNRDTTEISSV